jgi:small basic protein
MKYVLVRSGNRYGPYSVDEVRQYLAAGNIAADDLLEPETGGTPVRAAELTIPPNVPPPPSMDWWLVLILSLVTCTLFGYIWTFFQARWVKKLDPSSRATLYLVLSLLFIPIVIVVIAGGGVLSALTGIHGGGGEEAFGILFMLVSIVLGLGASVAIIACFVSMSQSLTTVTSTWGAARMDLGGTFLAVVVVGWFLNLLFAVAPVYLQYQFDRVRQFQAQAYQGGMAGPRVY